MKLLGQIPDIGNFLYRSVTTSREYTGADKRGFFYLAGDVIENTSNVLESFVDLEYEFYQVRKKT